MAEANLAVIITGHGKDLINEFQKIGKAADSAGDKTKSGWDKAKQGVQIAGAAIAGAAVAIGVASLHSADDFELANARLEAAVKATKGSFDAFAPAIDKTNAKMRDLGFKDKDTESSLATLTLATHSTSKALADMSLAADLARGRNIDLSTATGIIAKVETGHVALLGRLGIATKDATGKTISQEEAMRKLTTMFSGQAAKAAGTFAGKQQILSAQMDHLKVQIGLALIPILLRLAKIINVVIVWFEKHRAAAIALGVIVGVVLVAAVVAYTASMVAAAVATIAATWPILAIIVALAALAAGVLYAYTHWKWFRTAVNDAWAILQAVFGWVKSHWTLLASLLFGPIGAAVYLIVRNFDTIKSVAEDVFNTIASAVQPLIDAFNTIISLAGDVSSAISNINPLSHLPHSILGVHIPGFATGGVVPGPVGAPQLAVVHGGETITPRFGGNGSGGHVFNISVSTLDPRAAAPLIVEALQHYTDKNGSIPRVRIAG